MINYQTLRRIRMNLYTAIVILVLMFQLYEANRSSDCKKNVCLSLYEGEEDQFALLCVVPNMYRQIIFFSPNNREYAHCILPFPSSLCFTQNSNSSIVQDLKTNQTILLIKSTNDTDLNGTWSCSHGSDGDKESVDVVVKKRTPDDECINCWGFLFITFSVSVVIVGVFSNRKVWRKICRVRQLSVRRHGKRKDGEMENLCATVTQLSLTRHGRREDEVIDGEMENLCATGLHEADENKAKHSKCKTCDKETLFAICGDCLGFYCESCANIHVAFKDHHVIQIKQFVSKHKTKCYNCTGQYPNTVCRESKHFLCSDCVQSCGHSHDSNLVKQLIITEPIFIEPVVSTNNEYKSEVFRKKYNVLISSNKSETRIRGIAFLESGQFVLADYKARQLKFFSDKKQIFTKNLKMELRGLTGITRNRVAVTFAYEKKIILYDVKQVRVKKQDEFNLKDIGKPFQIAYHKNFFVVEVNEGKDGRIVILSHNGKAMHVIPNNNWEFGYFTGNTFRLQLDIIRKEVYVAAIGKKTVYCLDFSGDIKWRVKVPSPRSLVVLPNTHNNTSTLLLASRNTSMIYKLICAKSKFDSERYDVELVEMVDEHQIEQPDYMAYDHEKQLLYTEVANGYVSVYDMVSHQLLQ